MRPTFFGPLLKERREVTYVERHYDSALFGSESEHLGIVDALEVAALIKGEYIVTSLPELGGDHAAGDMCVKQ